MPPAARSGGISGWPWIGLVPLAILAGAAWWFRSWLVGVLENIVVLGKSGADLEVELLHHETGPDAPGAIQAPPLHPSAGSDGETGFDESGGETACDQPGT